MTASIFQLSDVGAPLRLAVKKRSDGSWETNLGSATSTKIHMTSPTGAQKEFTATVVETYKLSYIFTSGDLDEAGRWKAQGAFVLGAFNGRTDVVTLDVRANA
jgi:hypothetical protein